jgi:hypothetical protein
MHGYFSNQGRAASQARTRHRFDPDLLPDPPRQSRARKSKTGWKPSVRPKWRKQIKRTLNFYYGFPLPDDDAGRECFGLLCHAAFAELPPKTLARVVTQTAAMWADWMAKPELAALIDEVTNRPRGDLNRKKIGIELGLTQEVRMRDDVKAYDIWPVKFSHEDWKQWKAKTARERAARNRAKKRQARPTTKTAQAIAFLQGVLADGAQPVDRIMRLAVIAGLETLGATRCSKPMRSACETLGIVRRKVGMDAGWWWSLPETQTTPQPIDISEGALFSPDHAETPCFSEGALLRSPTSLRGLSERCDQCDDADEAPRPRPGGPGRIGPECVASRLGGTGLGMVLTTAAADRFRIDIPVELRAMMLAFRRGIIAAAVPDIRGFFPRTGVSGLRMER